MELIEFKQIAKILNVNITNGLEYISTELGLSTKDKYSFEYKGITFTYKKDSKGGYVSASKINLSIFTSEDKKIYGITLENSRIPGQVNSYRIDTREGLLLIIASSNPDNYDIEKINQAFIEMNRKVIVENLKIAQPQNSTSQVLDSNFGNSSIRNALKLFNASVNPYIAINIEEIDYTRYPAILHILGLEDKTSKSTEPQSRTLQITNLITGNYVMHTWTKNGFNSFLKYHMDSKTTTVEYFCSINPQEDTIKIINKENNEIVHEVDYDITNRKPHKATGIFAGRDTATLETLISASLQSCTKNAQEITKYCIPTSPPKPNRHK